MTATAFDLAISLDQTTLNTGFSQLYSNSDARNKLFKGSITKTISGMTAVLTYDFQQAPTFVIGSPSASDWSASIDAQGNNPTGAPPSTNAFTLMMPQFNGTVAIDGAAPVGGTTLVKVFATGSMGTGGKASFIPQSVWLDESQMGGIDKAILNGVIIPQILTTATSLLSGLTIIPPTITVGQNQVALTGQTMTIGGTTVLLTANLAQGSGAKTVTAMPSQPLSVLMTPEFMTAVATAGMVGTTKSDSGNSSGANYQYTITVNSTTAQTPSEGGPINISVGLNLDVSVEMLSGLCSARTAGSML